MTPLVSGMAHLETEVALRSLNFKTKRRTKSDTKNPPLIGLLLLFKDF